MRTIAEIQDLGFRPFASVLNHVLAPDLNVDGVHGRGRSFGEMGKIGVYQEVA